MVWTGSRFGVVWMEAEEPGDELPWLVEWDREFTMHLLVLPDGPDAKAEAVVLEGAGSGPKKLEGPFISNPVWAHGSLALAWVLWNEETGYLPPARYVVGMWRQDGTPVFEPRVVKKERIHNASNTFFVPLATLSAAQEGLLLAFLSDAPAKKTGCRFEHGSADTIEIIAIGPDGAAGEARFVCGDVIIGYAVHRFGNGLLTVSHNEHIGDHTWISCLPRSKGCHGEYYSAVNPFDRMVVTGAAAALWYDELDDEYELVGHCLDVLVAEGEDAGPAVTCARFKSQSLVWDDAGLSIELAAKDGAIYRLPFLPGDHVPAQLLRKSLAKKVGVGDAVWSGSSIGVTWAKGRKLSYGVLGTDALKPGGPPASAGPDPSP
jgi:hypothetical protein